MTMTTRREIHAALAGNQAKITHVGGAEETLTAPAERDLKRQIMTRAAQAAHDLGEPVLLISRDTAGEHHLLVQPDGTFSEDHPLIRDIPPLIKVPSSWTPNEPVIDIGLMSSVTPEVVTAETETASPRRAARTSFLAQENRVPVAREGWRGFLARTTKIEVSPSPAELTRREHVRLVSQHWPGPRKIGIANGKGGVGKTMTTAMLCAVFARYGGAGVLAWDNNDTSGTLGWRTEQGPHDSTVQDLLPATERLLPPAAQMSQLAHFVHHQTADKYDVLRSNPELLAAKQRIARTEFDALHDVAAKYFRMIMFDSGNDESAERWLRMIDHTDQLVIPTSAAGEPAESAALLLEALQQRDERSALLASKAVVIVSQAEHGTPLAVAQRIADGFADLAGVTVTIPFDKALKSGPLRFENLTPATQQAWLTAGAAVAAGL